MVCVGELGHPDGCHVLRRYLVGHHFGVLLTVVLAGAVDTDRHGPRRLAGRIGCLLLPGRPAFLTVDAQSVKDNRLKRKDTFSASGLRPTRRIISVLSALGSMNDSGFTASLRPALLRSRRW